MRTGIVCEQNAQICNSYVSALLRHCHIQVYSRAMDCICGHTDTYIPVDIVSNVTL